METPFKKKLQLSKKVVANLSKQEMDQNAGGLPTTAMYTCGTACMSNNKRCMEEYSGGRACGVVISLYFCEISRNPKPGYELTCGKGDYCGSDTNLTCIC